MFLIISFQECGCVWTAQNVPHAHLLHGSLQHHVLPRCVAGGGPDFCPGLHAGNSRTHHDTNQRSLQWKNAGKIRQKTATSQVKRNTHLAHLKHI